MPSTDIRARRLTAVDPKAGSAGRAVAYARSSKDRSDISIETQRRALHELAVARGLVIVDEFADAVESGKDEDRPAFQRLIAALKNPDRGWEHVLVLVWVSGPVPLLKKAA